MIEVKVVEEEVEEELAKFIREYDRGKRCY